MLAQKEKITTKFSTKQNSNKQRKALFIRNVYTFLKEIRNQNEYFQYYKLETNVNGSFEEDLRNTFGLKFESWDDIHTLYAINWLVKQVYDL